MIESLLFLLVMLVLASVALFVRAKGGRFWVVSWIMAVIFGAGSVVVVENEILVHKTFLNVIISISGFIFFGVFFSRGRR